MTHIDIIEGTIRTTDGRVRSFRMSADGWQQWGAPTEDLGNTCEALDTLRDAAMLADLFDVGDDETEQNS